MAARDGSERWVDDLVEVELDVSMSLDQGTTGQGGSEPRVLALVAV
jgi:hypothetical protein